MSSASRHGRVHCPTSLALIVIDCAIAFSAPFIALCLRNLFETGSPNNGSFAIYALSAASASLILLWSIGCWRATWKFFSSGDAAKAMQAIALGVAIGAVCGFAIDRLQAVPRTVPFIQVLIQVVAFAGLRMICRRMAEPRTGSVKKATHVLVVGCNQAALTYLNAVRELSKGSIEIAGLLSDDRRMVGQTIRGKRVLGTIAEAEDIVSTLQVHGVEVSRLAIASRLAPADDRALGNAQDRFSLSRIDVDAALAGFAIVADAAAPVDLEASPAMPWKPLYVLAKRGIDLCGASLLLVALAPLMLLLCPIVALDVGFPVLFWQQRLGKGGKRLTVYKFRTMRAPLDSAGHRIPDARRVSIIGRWMRKLRLDELPQLISILKGDMSFVGPRPLLPIDQPSDAARRLAVKPGLTGWAQVHGGNLVAIEDKNALDLWYVTHSSLRLDIEIALRTVRMLLQGDNVDSQKISQAKLWMSGFDYAGT